MSQLSIRYKIYLGYFIICFMIVIAGMLGFLTTQGISKMSLANNEVATKNVYYANQVEVNTNQGVDHIDEIKKATVPAQFLYIRDEFLEHSKKVQEATKQYSQLIQDSSRKENLENFLNKWNPYSELAIKLNERMAKDAASVDDFDAIYKKLEETSPEVRKLANQIIKFDYDSLNQSSVHIQKTTDAVQTGVFAVLGLLLLVSLALGYVLSQNLSVALTKISEAINAESFNIEESSQEIQNAASSLSSGATEQAASLAETVASMTEISSMVKNNTENAKTVVDLATQNRGQARQGVEQVTILSGAMTEITQSSKKIEDIINVIDDIAFQTNLLALNAAVEAARAGEQGKGFAVVAEAVRALAQRSSVAAKDISALIQDSVERVNRGAKIVQTSTEILNQIETSVQKVTTLNGEISEASQQQTNGIEQISQALNQIDSTSQTFAANSEQVTGSVNHLFSRARSLADLVRNLEVIVKGSLKNQKNADQSLSKKQESPIDQLKKKNLRTKQVA